MFKNPQFSDNMEGKSLPNPASGEGIQTKLRRLLGASAGRRCAPEADLFSAIYDGDVGCAAELALLEAGATCRCAPG